MARDTDFLNAFRAVSAFWVLSAHCAIWGGLPVPGLLDPKSAVDIFIVLSGFLMMLVASDAARRGWSDFYIHRFFRIAPLYYVVLIIVIVLQDPFLHGYQQLVDLQPQKWTGTLYDPSLISFDLKNIILHFTFIFGFLPYYSSSTLLPDWSIGLEMQLYAVFPILFYTQQRIGMLALGVMGAMISASWIWSYAQITKLGIAPSFGEPSFLAFKLHMFMVGMLIFVGWTESEPHKRFLLFALAIGICIAQYGLYGVRSLTVSGLVIIIIFLIFPTKADIIGRHFIKAILGGKFFKRLAEISYSVYFMQALFVPVVGGAVASFLQRLGWAVEWRVIAIWAAVLLCTYPVSWLTFAFVERPMIRLGRALGRCTAAPREV